MQLSNPSVVSAEKGKEVLSKVVFVELREGSNNAKVKGDVMALMRAAVADKNIAWVHVSMKIAVAKHLGEENFNTLAGELFKVDLCLFKALHSVYRNTVNPLHHNHVGLAVIPEHFWNLQKRRICKVTAQLRGIGGLAHKIELVVQVVIKLGYDLARLESSTVR